jgi:hypothetical protein
LSIKVRNGVNVVVEEKLKGLLSREKYEAKEEKMQVEEAAEARVIIRENENH